MAACGLLRFPTAKDSSGIREIPKIRVGQGIRKTPLLLVDFRSVGAIAQPLFRSRDIARSERMSGRFKAQRDVRARLAHHRGETLGVFERHDWIVGTG